MISTETEAGASAKSARLAAARARLTQLWQVERDGNPHRRFAQVSPFIGKIGPLDAGALRRIARLMTAALPELPERTLILGLTESSLLLAWFLAACCAVNVELRFTTRLCRSAHPSRTFQESHSHGPEHFLALEADCSHPQIVIVEDELTTGATLKNLSLALRDVSARHDVVTLADLRTTEMKHGLQAEMSAHGVALSVTDISRVETSAPGASRWRPQSLSNPFGRALTIRALAQETLHQLWRELRPSEIYVISECVDVALAFWESLPARERPAIRQVTRSPWVVDGRAIRTRLDLGEAAAARYFLYNWLKPNPPRALIVGEAVTAPVAARLQEYLRSQRVIAASVEVQAG